MSGALQAVFQNFRSSSASYYLTSYSRVTADDYGFQGDLTYDATTDKVYVGQTYNGTSVAFSRLTTSTFTPDYTVYTNAFGLYSDPAFLYPVRQPTTGNMIVFGSSAGTTNPYFSSYTTSNPPTISWSRRINISGIPSYNSGDNRMYGFTLQSDGSLLIFGAAIGYYGACCDARYTPVIVKLSADGQTLTNFATGNSGTNNDYVSPRGGIVASSGNVYSVGSRYKSGSYKGASVIKFNSSGAVQWKYYYANAIPTGYAWAPTSTSRFIAVDSSENVYFSGALGSYAVLTKIDSSGNVLWARQWTPPNGGFYGGSVVLDSSNNVYVWGGYSGYLFLLKYNSSGTLQFARQWTASSTNTSNIYNNRGAIAIANDGSLMYGWYGIASGNSKGQPYYVKMPADGSKTGSYSNQGLTWVYSSASGTDQAWTWNVSDDTQLTFGSTPTLSTTNTVPSGVTAASVTRYANTL